VVVFIPCWTVHSDQLIVITLFQKVIFVMPLKWQRLGCDTVMVIKKLPYLVYCHSSLPDEVVVIISVFFLLAGDHTFTVHCHTFLNSLCIWLLIYRSRKNGILSWLWGLIYSNLLIAWVLCVTVSQANNSATVIITRSLLDNCHSSKIRQ